MAYSTTSLDEIPELELQQELHRRLNAQMLGLCDYCGKNGSEPTCRFKDRHAVAAKRAHLLKNTTQCVRCGGSGGHESECGACDGRGRISVEGIPAA